MQRIQLGRLSSLKALGLCQWDITTPPHKTHSLDNAKKSLLVFPVWSAKDEETQCLPLSGSVNPQIADIAKPEWHGDIKVHTLNPKYQTEDLFRIWLSLDIHAPNVFLLWHADVKPCAKFKWTTNTQTHPQTYRQITDLIPQMYRSWDTVCAGLWMADKPKN